MIELILFTIAIATVVALLISLIHMNWLINTLYEFGLQLSYEWTSSYYLTLRIVLALLGILVITSLSMVILYRKVLKVKAPGIERARYSRILTRVAGYAFLLFGVLSLVLSIINETSILALIGLGLTFWGALLFFIRPVRYVKSNLLDSTSLSTLTNVAQLIDSLNYKGKGVYLPPRYLQGIKEGKVFIPNGGVAELPKVEEISKENIFLKDPEGICLKPSGLGLVNLFEEELGTNFAKVNLSYLQNNLPRLLIEGLEIVEDLEIETHGNLVQVKMTETIYKDVCNELRKLHSSFDCPLCSSIACAIARSSGEPVVIEKINAIDDGKTIEAYYQILGTTPSADYLLKEQPIVDLVETAPRGVSPEEVITLQPKKVVREVPPETVRITRSQLSHLFPNLISSVLSVIGLYILVWVGWLTWTDVTTWSKSPALIFFGPRTGEAISLGVGMRVIHYLLMGVALLLSGISIRKRGK